MENFDFIQFQKRRDFSEKVNVSFYFVKQNFKSFLKAIILIAGPPILITSLLMSSFMKEFFKLGMGAATDPGAFSEFFLSSTFWTEVGLMFLFMIVGYVAIISTTYNYIILYREKKSNVIETSEVWTRVRESLGMYFVTMILMVVLTLAAYALMLIPVVIFGQVSPFLIFFAVVGVICLLIYFAISVSLVFVVRGFENTGFFPALSRSMYLIRGKWWSTFGLLMILSIIIAVISYVFSIPASIIQTVSAIHTTEAGVPGEDSNTATLVFVLNSLAYICQLMLYFLPCLGLAFQYFNLVEMKESKGLMDQIGTIGQPPSPRPDAGNY